MWFLYSNLLEFSIVIFLTIKWSLSCPGYINTNYTLILLQYSVPLIILCWIISLSDAEVMCNESKSQKKAFKNLLLILMVNLIFHFTFLYYCFPEHHWWRTSQGEDGYGFSWDNWFHSFKKQLQPKICQN